MIMISDIHLRILLKVVLKETRVTMLSAKVAVLSVSMM